MKDHLSYPEENNFLGHGFLPNFFFVSANYEDFWAKEKESSSVWNVQKACLETYFEVKSWNSEKNLSFFLNFALKNWKSQIFLNPIPTKKLKNRKKDGSVFSVLAKNIAVVSISAEPQKFQFRSFTKGCCYLGMNT